MKFITFVLAGLFTTSSFAQIHFGTSHEYTDAKIFKKINDNYHNNILIRDPDAGFLQCQKDHGLILDIFKEKNKVYIARLLVRINDLSRTKEYEGYVKSLLNKQLMEKLIDYIVISEMKKELNRKSIKQAVWDKHDKNPKTNTKIFEMKFNGVDINSYFSDALNAAAKYKSHHKIPVWFLADVKANLITEIVKQLGKNSFKVVVNGVAIQFASNLVKGAVTEEILKAGLKKSIISFSGNVMASAGTGLLINILTLPLKGNRLPPESLWLDLLNDYPGLILNPELMSSAGIHDDEWSTHCHTINRRPHSLEKIITKLSSSLDKEFAAKQLLITEVKEMERTGSKDQTRVKIDNTYVAPRPSAQIRLK